MSPQIDEELDEGLQPLAEWQGANEAGFRPEYDSSDEDSETDDEDVSGNQRGKVSVEVLLEDILKEIDQGTLDLSDKHQFETFKTTKGDDLGSKTGNPLTPTALHIMAAQENLPRLDSRMEPLIKFLAAHQNNLKEKDRFGRTPLSLAIENKKEKMVLWMCDAHSRVSKVLDMRTNDRMNSNCLHIAINKRLKCLNLLINIADVATLISADANGNTPLHLAVEYKKCRKGQLGIIEQIVAKTDHAILNGSMDKDFNQKRLSPLRHHKDSVQNAIKRENEKKKKAKGRDEGDKSANRRLTPGSVLSPPISDTSVGHPKSNLPMGSSVKTPNGVSRPERRTESQMDPRTKYGEKQIQPLSRVKTAETGAPKASQMLDDKKRPTLDDPSLIDVKAGTSSDSKSSKIDQETVKNVERFLKLHYLRSRSYNVAMEILYGHDTTPDKEVFFDLVGHSNVTQEKLGNLLSKLKFEDVLQYVAIPRIKITSDSSSSNKKAPVKHSARSSKFDGNGRQDLCYIFNQLRQKGVDTILKVIVDDSDIPGHSDEAIEKALDHFTDIEVWDWKRFDLCSEVIFRVAPKAREVHLYWGGNNAILRGWSEEEGLKKLTNLREVYLHVEEGLESSSRTQKNCEEFVRRMRKLNPEVRIHTKSLNLRRETLGINLTQADESVKHEWIQCMDEFRKLIFDAEKYYGYDIIQEKIEPIKVALIDDGVDIKDLAYSFIGGRTFCTRDEAHNLSDPYYVSSTGHGTIMAQQIYLLCPRAQFYVLRLEDHGLEGATRQITARSAAQAIRAAIKKKVHIISMSWTIDPPEDDDDRRTLEDAIQEAAKKDILMFCSASDRGAKQIETYPGKATPKIFKIGAATADGATAAWVGDPNNVSFTLPGNRVGLEVTPNFNGAERDATGSSVATALAAGLAALILYCAQIRIMTTDSDQARGEFDKLKTHEHMMRAFKDIGTTEESNHKFITVWELFGEQVQKKDRRDTENWIDLIAEVGDILCRRIRV